MSDIRQQPVRRTGSESKPACSEKAVFDVRSYGASVRLVGELDLSTVGRLQAALDTLSTRRTHALDLTDLSFMDMVGLHALEQHARTLNGSGPLVLENVSPHIRRLFEVVGADHAANLEIRG